MAVLELGNVSQRFAAGWVLLHVDLQVERGERLLLLGDNGGGKTTLLRLCATAIEPTRGRVRLFAGATPGCARRRLALMTHQHHFYEGLSARANLMLVASVRQKPRARVADVLTRVALARVADEPVATFSAGMKRRLALARVLLLEPELVLLDEPFSQLDVAGVTLVESVLDTWREQGVTWLMATHDAERGARLATHTIRLAGGEATVTQSAGGPTP